MSVRERPRIKKISPELIEQLQKFQEQLAKELGMNVSFVNASRAAARSLQVRDVKFIKVQPPRYKKKHEKLLFEP